MFRLFLSIVFVLSVVIPAGSSAIDGKIGSSVNGRLKKLSVLNTLRLAGSGDETYFSPGYFATGYFQ